MIKYVQFIFLRFLLYGLDASDINSFIGQEVEWRKGMVGGGGLRGGEKMALYSIKQQDLLLFWYVLIFFTG